MRESILAHLKNIEADHDVRILFACESGSRAWGFASPDSDFDVRFIYARRASDYLTIKDRRAVIELPVNEVLDIGGWDLKKALQLFLKSNAPLYEWLQSPITYIDDGALKSDLLSLTGKYFSLRSGLHHYLSMANNTLVNDLVAPEVQLKKYFYALRPLFAARWIVEKRELPPMQFNILRTLLNDPGLNATIDTLLALKFVTIEKGFVPQVAVIQQWITETLAELTNSAGKFEPTRNDNIQLDLVFRKFIANDF